MSKLRAYWDSRSLFGKIAMAIALPIFAIVAGAEHLIARMTGAIYNEVNPLAELNQRIFNFATKNNSQ